MDTNSAASAQTDPMTAVAEAMDAAIEAAKGGAAQARATVADLAPAAGESLSRAVYRTSYTVAYGLVFPVAAGLPGDADGQRARPRPGRRRPGRDGCGDRDEVRDGDRSRLLRLDVGAPDARIPPPGPRETSSNGRRRPVRVRSRTGA